MNGDTQHIMDELLVKYLLGEATPLNRRQVDEWLALSEANRKYYNGFALIWEQSKQVAAQSPVNEDEAWQRFKARVAIPDETRSDQPAIPLQHHGNAPRVMELPSRRLSHIRAAALLLVLVGAGWLAWYMNTDKNLTLQTSQNTITATLPDGSTVTLNKTSKLSYPKHFGDRERLVVLEGEAFFDVAHDKAHPFVIKANEASIRVVGTSFNVKSSEERTEVIVATGVVKVIKDRFAVELKAHEKATVLKDEAKPVKQNNTDELYNFYKTKELICNGTPLWRVVDVLNDAYGVHISIGNPALRDLRLTTTFRNESIDNILAVISETFNIEVVRRKGEILLK